MAAIMGDAEKVAGGFAVGWTDGGYVVLTAVGEAGEALSYLVLSEADVDGLRAKLLSQLELVRMDRVAVNADGPRTVN